MADSIASFNPDDFARLRAVEDTHFWFVSRNDVLAAALSTLPRNGSGPQSILEIGCGTGNTLRVLRHAFPHASIVGVDPFYAGLQLARTRCDAHLIQAQIERLPFRKPFALISLFDVLEHVDDDVGALTAIRRLLEPGGVVLMTVPADPSLWSRLDEESGHFRRYSERQLRSVVEAAGLRVEYASHFMAMTYPIVWLSRRLDRWMSPARSVDRRPAIERELRVPFAINTAFRQLLRVESSAIRHRRGLPFGASLLAMIRA